MFYYCFNFVVGVFVCKTHTGWLVIRIQLTLLILRCRQVNDAIVNAPKARVLEVYNQP